MDGPERAWGITNHEVIVQINLVKFENYITTVHVKVMVTQATSYDVLIGGGGQFCTP